MKNNVGFEPSVAEDRDSHCKPSPEFVIARRESSSGFESPLDLSESPCVIICNGDSFKTLKIQESPKVFQEAERSLPHFPNFVLRLVSPINMNSDVWRKGRFL